MKLLIKEVRKRKRVSQTQLAKKSGVARGYISEMESGKYLNPSINVLCRIKKVLECKLDELVDCDD